MHGGENRRMNGGENITLDEIARRLFADNEQVIENAVTNALVVGEAVVWMDNTGKLHHGGDVRGWWQFGFNPLTDIAEGSDCGCS